LKFSDQNKFPIEMLEWRMEVGSDHDLLALMESRIRVRLGIPNDTTEIWEKAFAETGMRGGEHKLAFMEKRSFLRPRDVIKFSNLSLEEAKKRVAVGKHTTPLITSTDVLKARSPYSTWLVKELNDEVAAHRDDWKKLMEPLRRIGRPHFEIRSYEKEFEALDLSKQTELKALEALRFLYDFGIVAFKRVGGGGGGSAWIARYERGNEDVELDTRAMSFRVHPGLKEYLHIKEH
jgi:hypothetical protein